MLEFFKEYWFYISSAFFIGGFTYYMSHDKSKTKIEQEKPKLQVTKPKSDSLIHVVDSVLELKKKLALKKEIEYRKKEESLRKQLELEKSEKKKLKKNKPKVVVQTKEIVVEKVIKQPIDEELIKQSYKVQEENCHLKEILEKTEKEQSILKSENEKLKKVRIEKDFMSADTIRKKKRWGFF